MLTKIIAFFALFALVLASPSHPVNCDVQCRNVTPKLWQNVCMSSCEAKNQNIVPRNGTSLSNLSPSSRIIIESGLIPSKQLLPVIREKMAQKGKMVQNGKTLKARDFDWNCWWCVVGEEVAPICYEICQKFIS